MSMRHSGSPVGFCSSACMCGHTCMNGSVEVPLYIHKTNPNQRGINQVHGRQGQSHIHGRSLIGWLC